MDGARHGRRQRLSGDPWKPTSQKRDVGHPRWCWCSTKTRRVVGRRLGVGGDGAAVGVRVGGAELVTGEAGIAGFEERDDLREPGEVDGLFVG